MLFRIFCCCCNKCDKNDDSKDSVVKPSQTDPKQEQKTDNTLKWNTVVTQPVATHHTLPNLKNTLSVSKQTVTTDQTVKRNDVQREVAQVVETNYHRIPQGIPTAIDRQNFLKPLNTSSKSVAIANHKTNTVNKHKGCNTAEPIWKTSDILHEKHNLTACIAKQLVQLFSEGNTIPFIARHRKDIIGQMTTEKLRNVRKSYDRLEHLKIDIAKIHALIAQMQLMNDSTHAALLNVKHSEILNEIYAPFKHIYNTQLSIERENFAVLNEAADLVLQGKDSNTSAADVICVVATKIANSAACIDFLEDRCKRSTCTLKTAQRYVKNKQYKFENYCNKSYKTNQLQPNQIMAINRAEQNGVLNVMLEVDNFWLPFSNHMKKHFSDAVHSPVFIKALQHCYNKMVIQMFKRMKRAALTEVAEQAAVDVFSSNLKQLLLTVPVKNTRILGMDPGTTLGCKLGIISETGDVLAIGVVYSPAFCKPDKRNQQKQELRGLLLKHSCSLIALGNGTGCREAEAWISNLIKINYFHPLHVSYTIVVESGASVYSCSSEAIREFGTMDPIYIGAISLARRLQDPLSELVKVDPRHLGIGMYQHDIDQHRLQQALTAVVSECVSLVGVDVNTASECVLRHVAGLSETLAKRIVLHRERRGRFKQRAEIYAIPGVGTLTYRQCAGFLRILNGSNRLDATDVHPESYDMARQLMKLMGVRVDQIGTNTFRLRLVKCRGSLETISGNLGTSRERLHYILDGLTEATQTGSGGGARNNALWFRSDVVKITDLVLGMELTGIVVNVTLFGSFVDVGIGRNGLISVTNSGNITLKIYDRVRVKVCNLNIPKNKIGLKFTGFIK